MIDQFIGCGGRRERLFRKPIDTRRPMAYYRDHTINAGTHTMNDAALRDRNAIFLMFLASGFCGLLYQIVWMRLAFAAFGAITPVLSFPITVMVAKRF
ncbi:MAG TPA: hypothetical protein PK388_04900, partial [Kiritimatiellia bacterium]|nr:hypothetical protein [Kiritimatiellia bacterium]